MLIYSNTQMYMSMQGPLMGHGTSFYIYSVYIPTALAPGPSCVYTCIVCVCVCTVCVYICI